MLHYKYPRKWGSIVVYHVLDQVGRKPARRAIAQGHRQFNVIKVPYKCVFQTIEPRRSSVASAIRQF
ncbi:hypothetical protein AMTR_s00030p00133160 [Amborella trichopoda]|uniref:Uncharacterized protein n=1 Tax=Amborella trichopoda TaxID=13333 RepID=U5CS76_AMBTC|nr:hypothetical protein AMTR_s00030p00133160 [Amborella trichopoda]